MLLRDAISFVDANAVGMEIILRKGNSINEPPEDNDNGSVDNGEHFEDEPFFN
jgi:hypothetical protein